MDGIKVDASDLRDLGMRLRRMSHEVRGEIDKTLVVIGTEITARAKAKAGEHSKTIAGTIEMRAVPGAVEIHAGNADVPIAALYELGNKGSGRGVNVPLRHPVFGNRDVWVEQKRYPFLRPALAEDRLMITRRMEETWDRALAKARLR